MNKLLESTAILEEAERIKWVNDLSAKAGGDLVYKYFRGQQEHGGDLGAVRCGQLLREAYEESLDQIFYISEIKRRMDLHEKMMKDLLEIVTMLHDDSSSNRALLTREQREFILTLRNQY